MKDRNYFKNKQITGSCKEKKWFWA